MKNNILNKFFSRTWIIAVFAMMIAIINTVIFAFALFAKPSLDVNWYVPVLGFCSGVIGLFVGTEKLIDKERVINEGYKNNQENNKQINGFNQE